MASTATTNLGEAVPTICEGLLSDRLLASDADVDHDSLMYMTTCVTQVIAEASICMQRPVRRSRFAQRCQNTAPSLAL